MSIKFCWPSYEQQKPFIALLKDSLTEVLNDGATPNAVVAPIKVTGVDLGSQPPEIEILNITGTSSQETFTTSIRIIYTGSASIQLETVVQVNRLSGTPSQYSSRALTRVGILCAHHVLNVPIKLAITHIDLAGILIIVKSKNSLEFSFKNDPLTSVQITSTFDSLPPARKAVQRMVEGRLRDFMMIRLPAMSKKITDAFLKLYPPETT